MRTAITRWTTKIGAVALVAAGFTMTTATSSQAIFNAEQTQHIIECATWLLTDPETHAANCLPSRVAVPFRSLSEPVTGYTGPPRVVPKPDVPPVVVDPCPPHETYARGGNGGECGGGKPSEKPSWKPSEKPSWKPSWKPSEKPSWKPSEKPSFKDSDKKPSFKDSDKKPSFKDSDKKPSEKRPPSRR